MRQRAIEVQFDKKKQSHMLVQPFDTLRDVFYIPVNKFKTFCLQPQDYDLDISIDPPFVQADVKYVALMSLSFEVMPLTN